MPPRAGGEVTSHYRSALDAALAELLAGMKAGPPIRSPSAAVQHSLIGGAVSLIVQKMEAGEGDRIGELRPDLVELFLTPFVGRAEAVARDRQDSLAASKTVGLVFGDAVLYCAAAC